MGRVERQRHSIRITARTLGVAIQLFTRLKKVVTSKLKFKGNVLPVKEKGSKWIRMGGVILRKKKSKKEDPNAKLEKLLVKPGEEKDYHPVEQSEDYRTEAEKRFDERLKQKVEL